MIPPLAFFILPRAGDHPLVRVTLQPPMDAPLQPGATLGVFLDLRAAHGPGADPAVQPSCLQVGVGPRGRGMGVGCCNTPCAALPT